MCGMVGWISYSHDLRAHEDAIAAMMVTMARRGPDADGIWLDTDVLVASLPRFVADLLSTTMGAAMLLRRQARR